MANLIIQENGSPRTTPAVHGEELTISAPCDCSQVTGVKINGVEFPFYDAAGRSLNGIGGLFAEGSLIRVMVDVGNKRAYILNAGNTAHDADTTKHITATERSNWNNKVSTSDLTSHTGNTTVHITAAERTAWNAKQAALSFDSTPTSGSANPVTSGGVYTALSNKAASGHKHSTSDITSGTLPVARGGTGNTTVDTTPTSGSTKMVTSGGIYTALAGKAASNHTHDYAASSHTHTKSQITDFPTSMKPTAHNQAASTITAGTLAGQVNANATATAAVGTAQVRDIYAGTDDMTAGTTSLTSGVLYFVYE